MPGAVDAVTKRARCAQLHALATRMREAALRRFVGTERRVLFEGCGDPCDAGYRWRGYAENYLPVEVVLEDDRDLDNAIRSVRIDDVARGRLVGRELGSSA
jgi:tRNA A37 methylthiotransferase MiaB